MKIRAPNPREIPDVKQQEIRTQLSLSALNFRGLCKAAEDRIHSEDLIQGYTSLSERKALLRILADVWKQCFGTEYDHGLSRNMQDRQDNLLFTIGKRIVRNGRRQQKRATGMPQRTSNAVFIVD